VDETTQWIRLEGAVNTREVAGMSASDGRTVQRRRLLRSDSLHALTDADVALLVGHYDVTTVVELRDADETRLEKPCPLQSHPGVSFLRTPMLARPPTSPNASIDADTVLREVPDSSGKSPYWRYLTQRPASIVSAMKSIAEASGAAIVNCAAGKDRTGLVVAFALVEVGVGEDDAVADYMASASRVRLVLERLGNSATYGPSLAGRSVESYTPRPELLGDVLSGLRAQYGGLHGWLAKYGWGSCDRTRLRDKLLEPSQATT